MTLTAGDRVRFTAHLRCLDRPADCSVTAQAITPLGAVDLLVQSKELGVFFTDVIVQAGTLTIVFRANTGEENMTTYDVDPKVPIITPMPEAPLPEWVIEEVAAPAPPLPKFDRADARRRLMAAGIPVDDSWSEGKLRGALEGLDWNERQRRVWK